MNYLKLSYRRWLGWLALALVFAIACAGLSNWQFARREQVVAVIEQLKANYDQPPITLQQARDAPVGQLRWRPVAVTGSYLSDKALLVRNRSRNGNPGFEQLVPFQTETGIVFVDRGWIPTGQEQDSPDVNPLPGTGDYQLVGHIMPSEPRLDRSAPAGQIASISLYLAAHQLDFKPSEITRTFYLALSDETPQVKLAPLKLPRPDYTEGNHLSYALQWIAFAVMGFAALVWAIRQEFDEYRAATDASYKPRKRRVTRGEIDADLEDQILDDA